MLSKGGLPIMADKRVIGGIGASGGTGDQDLAVVEAAIAADGLPMRPPRKPL
ncbi:heme-binding protein [Amycolatopsis sp. NPDC098790]|uniref:heme-binding protein n=1 Tax=Amycolatopsis sp. NPDC098790 TaxID=3363939 RepID=UPI00380D56D5